MVVLAVEPVQAVAAQPPTTKTITTTTSRSLPDYYPSSFPRTGVVQKHNAAARNIIISGTRYYYTNNIKIHILSSQSGYIHNLSAGTEVGFSYTEDDKRRRFLVEAWTLPKGTVKGDL
jgi:hypothetical protein